MLWCRIRGGCNEIHSVIDCFIGCVVTMVINFVVLFSIRHRFVSFLLLSNQSLHIHLIHKATTYLNKQTNDDT